MPTLLVRLLFLGIMTCSASVAGAQPNQLYWTSASDQTISSADLDGANAGVLLSGLAPPYGLAIDPVNGKLYWGREGTPIIKRANLDGSGVEDVVTDVDVFPAGLAPDPYDGKIYWMNKFDGLYRSDLAGNNTIGLRTGIPGEQQAVQLDVLEGKVYWSHIHTYEDPVVSAVHRLNMDNTGSIEVLISPLGSSSGLVLDLAARRLYWGQFSRNRILQMNLDGTGIQTFLAGLDSPRSLAIDVAAGKLYWGANGKIQRANLDGTGVEDVVPVANVTEIALDVMNPLGPVALSAQVFLQGAYTPAGVQAGGGTMRTDLLGAGILPTAQPYHTAPWDYAGTEAVSSIPPDIVDWVLLDVRAAPEGPSLARRAALVRSNGDVVDLDGLRAVTFPGLAPGAYHLAVYHRYHLAAVSAAPVTLTWPLAVTDTPAAYDFTAGQVTGTNGMVELEPGLFGLWGADGNADGDVTAFDFLTVWLPNNDGAVGYRASDFNMDSITSAFDFLNVWLAANGQSSQVP